jgi:exodeoxyribonuclease VII small subunit
MTAESKPDTYEQKFAKLEGILKRLDDSKTPIDELAADVKEGAALILALNAKLREVETEVADAFRSLDAAAAKSAPAREDA